MSSEIDMTQGPPYFPPVAQLGGVPTVSVDIPIDAVIILFFVIAAATNMTIFQLNNRQKHKFVLSGATFGFCVARTTANVLRIVWACYPSNVRIMIAALIFANAGVILLFAINLIFTQRLNRSFHPKFGWSRPVTYAFRFLYTSFVLCLIMLIVAIVYTFYTRDQEILAKLRKVQLTASTWFTVMSFLPIPIALLSVAWPHARPIDKFGAGKMRTKVYLLLFTATILCFGASFRSAVAYLPQPFSDPAWYDSRAAYFCVNYVIELIVVYTYTFIRFDKRFWVPNGSSEPGHYRNGVPDTKAGELAAAAGDDDEVFGGGRPLSDEDQQEKERQWETRAEAEQRNPEAAV